MKESWFVGKFQAISTFAIKSRGEFYIIGKLTEGEVQANWFVNVQLNMSLTFALRIKQVEIVEMAGDTTEYSLLTIEDRGDNFFSPFLNVNISSELIYISVEGEEWTDEK